MQNYAVKLYERVRSYIDKAGLSQGDIAKIMALPVRKFNYYLTEKSQVNLWPLLPILLQNDKKLSREWLYFGEGAMFTDEACDTGKSTADGPPTAVPYTSNFGQSMEFLALGELSAATVTSPIRLTGLTECGLHGWFSRAYRSVNVSPPRCGEHWVVVQAMGDSMVPYGIMEGYTLFCDPSQPPATGEAVYVLRRDGHATVKVFQGRDAQGRIVLQGWQAGAASGQHQGGEAGGQEAYYLYCAPADIALLASVIYIKCRL